MADVLGFSGDPAAYADARTIACGWSSARGAQVAASRTLPPHRAGAQSMIDMNTDSQNPQPALMWMLFAMKDVTAPALSPSDSPP